MSQPLPISNFRWLFQEEIRRFNVLDIENDSEYGYMLEVDLDYPDYLHDAHRDYPLAPEKLYVKPNMLSGVQLEILGVDSADEVQSSKQIKLVPNLYNKKNYILHYWNLKFYINHGMKLMKIHRILKFKQEPWLKSYIDFNTERRANARNSFEKEFFKLMNNSCFGKTMENLRKRRRIELITSRAILRKRVAQPSFHDFHIINEDLVVVERKKTSLLLNRPIYTGLAVLDISKLHMYQFHYDHIKRLYPERKSRLLFTDTDSLAYAINTDDIYEDMKNNVDLYDFSNYPEDHKCYSAANRLVIGKFKDELGSLNMEEFVGLRSKMYSFTYKMEDKMKEIKKAKGVKKSVVKRKISHMDYVKTLFEDEDQYREWNSFRSYKHRIYTIKVNKKSLSCFDDKRYILGDGITTLPHGHKNLI
ncbi:uncharacterized protein [Clytia hemisphaerica]